MRTIFIDTLTYRWRQLDGAYYFGRTINNDFPAFADSEKRAFTSEILLALLLHDKIFIKIDSLEEFIVLAGINPTLTLLKNDILVVINDGGTLTGFTPNEGDNLLMNFNSVTTFSYPQVMKRLLSRYNGSFESKLIKPLILRAEESSVEVDGAWLGHLANEENIQDLDNPRILSYLRFSKSYQNTIVKDEDILPLMRLNYLNKSLVYLSELNISSLLTESETQNLLNVKISHYINRVSDKSLTLFNSILVDKKLPDLAALYLEKLLTIEDIIRLRESFEGKLFRKWLENENYEKESIYSTLMSSNKNLDNKLLTKMIRWVYPKAAGLLIPILGSEILFEAIDSQIVDRMLKGWHPNFFLDEKLSTHLNKLTNASKKQQSINREIKTLSRRRKPWE